LLFPVGDCRAQVGVAVTPSGTSKGQGASLHEGLQKSPSISIIWTAFLSSLLQGSLFVVWRRGIKRTTTAEGESKLAKVNEAIVSASSGEGGLLRLQQNKTFMEDEHPILLASKTFRIVWRTSCDRRTSPSTAFAS
jgi:hypothetical protein